MMIVCGGGGMVSCVYCIDWWDCARRYAWCVYVRGGGGGAWWWWWCVVVVVRGA